MTDPSHVLDYKPLKIDESLSYAEQLVEILAREGKMLRNRGIPLVKVLWRNHKVKRGYEGNGRRHESSLPRVVRGIELSTTKVL